MQSVVNVNPENRHISIIVVVMSQVGERVGEDR
jgi:hypothetical protein